MPTHRGNVLHMDVCAGLLIFATGMAFGYLLCGVRHWRRRRPNPTQGKTLEMDVTEDKQNS